jgi:RimJ/RimL family protein N-acetyltransferase
MSISSGRRQIPWSTASTPHYEPESIPAEKIMAALGRAGWGHGYATEAAAPSVAFGFDRCGLPRIVAVVRHDNAASRKVLRKVGLRHVRDGRFYEADAALYAIDRS